MSDATAPATLVRGDTRLQASRSEGGEVASADEAFELFLAFIRLARAPRQQEEIPNRVRALLREGVLAPRHLKTFAIVAMHGPLSVSALAQREGCATTTASLLATQLADAGLVERREDRPTVRKGSTCSKRGWHHCAGRWPAWGLRRRGRCWTAWRSWPRRSIEVARQRRTVSMHSSKRRLA